MNIPDLIYELDFENEHGLAGEVPATVTVVDDTGALRNIWKVERDTNSRVIKIFLEDSVI